MIQSKVEFWLNSLRLSLPNAPTNAAGKGATALANITKFDIEDHCVDLFYWFHKSNKRKGEAEYYEFRDTEYEEVVKYISVRRLCLERCLDKELNKYVALTSNFFFEQEHEARFQRLSAAFSEPMTEVYLMFFQSAITMFSNFNRFLQREDPLIYLMHAQMESFMTKRAASKGP